MIHAEPWYRDAHGLEAEWAEYLKKFREGEPVWDRLATLADRLGKVRELGDLSKVGLSETLWVEEFAPSRSGRPYRKVGSWWRTLSGVWIRDAKGYQEATMTQALERLQGLTLDAASNEWGARSISDSEALEAFLEDRGFEGIEHLNPELRAELDMHISPTTFERGAKEHGSYRWKKMVELWKSHYGWGRPSGVPT